MAKITTIATLSVVAFVLSSIGYMSLDYFEAQDLPKHPAFNTLTCDEIVNQNQLGIIYTTDDPTFSEERIIECLREHSIALELMDYKGSQLECIDKDGVWANDQCYPGPDS